ncbi:MAG: hypothetical protein ACJ74U_10385 [Jatrophihabitantaceae bacterium]
MSLILTPGQVEDAGYVASLAEANVSVVLDLRDERQLRHLRAIHALCGITPETRPGMFEILDAGLDQAPASAATVGVADAQGFISGALVTDISVLQDTEQASATGFIGFVDGAYLINAAMVVTPKGGEQVLATTKGQSQFKNGTYFPLQALPVTGQVAAARMTATLTYSWLTSPTSQWSHASVSRDVTVGKNSDPCLWAPTKHQTGHLPTDYIRIALGRGAPGDKTDDVDYWYGYGTDVTEYLTPLWGYADFPGIIETPLVLDQNLFVFGILNRGSGGTKGGYKLLPDSEQRRIADASQASGNRLNWNLFPPDLAKQTTGNSINWGELQWTSGEADYLTVQVEVNSMVEGAWQKVSATVQCSDDPDHNDLDGSLKISPLQFLYSCLAAGTPIRMADGSQTAIEDLVRGDLVAGPDGAVREVRSTVIARHRGKALRLTYDGGTVVLSHNHPVMTPRGMKKAEWLAPGDEVHTVGGVSKIGEVLIIDFDERLCNASLSAPGAPVPEPTRNTMYAAGLEVGDYEVQLSTLRDERRDPTAILAELDPRYHQDYRNYLAEQAAR